MKKLFTLLILACAFLAGNAQVTVDKTFFGYRNTGDLVTSVDNPSVSFSLNNNLLLKLSTIATASTQVGTIVNASASNTISVKGNTYTPLQLGGTSSRDGGADFTPEFGDNVKSVSMWAVCVGTSSQTITYNEGKFTIPATGNDPVEIPLTNNKAFNLGNYKIYTVYEITYEETLPVEISEFSSEVNNLTPSSAEIVISYTATNVNDETTFTLYYKDQANTEGEYSSVPANSTGGTISLNSLTAETVYTYDIYLAVNGEKIDNATTTATFTTLSGPTIPWTVNYAEIASASIPWNTEIKVNANPTEEDKSYITVDQNKNYKIGSTNANNFKFSVTYDGETLIAQDNVTTGSSGSIALSYAGNNGNLAYTGLRGTSSTNRFGILDLKAGDIVEIAFLAGAGYDSTSAADEDNLINLTYSSTKSDYVLTVDHNGEKQLNYKVFSYKVNEDGNAAFTLPNYTYIAYIAVNLVRIADSWDFEEYDGDQEVTVKDATVTILKGFIENETIQLLVAPKVDNVTVTGVYYKILSQTKMDYDETETKSIKAYVASENNGYEKAYQKDKYYIIDLPADCSGEFSMYYNYTTEENGKEQSSEPQTVSYIASSHDGLPTEVEAVEETEDGEAVYFNLQGVKVRNPEHGIFVKVQNGKASKVIL